MYKEKLCSQNSLQNGELINSEKLKLISENIQQTLAKSLVTIFLLKMNKIVTIPCDHPVKCIPHAKYGKSLLIDYYC